MYYVPHEQTCRAILSYMATFLARQDAAAFTIPQPKLFYSKREAIPWRCIAEVTCMQECDDVGIWDLLFCKSI